MDQHLTVTICILLSKVRLPISSSTLARNDPKCPLMHYFRRWRGKNIYLQESEYKYILGN